MSTSTSLPAELRLPAPRPKAIDVAAALEQVGGDFEFVMAVMRDEFLARAPNQIARCVTNARLADAHRAGEKHDAALKALAFEAHSMKGASATLHADALSEACHRLERVAKGVPPDALEPNRTEDAPFVTFEQRTREIADRFAELETDVADLAAITDVDVAAASEALGSRLCVTLARLAEDAAALAASPAAVAAAARACGGGDARTPDAPLASLARTVAADAKAAGARALRDAVRRMDALVFSRDTDRAGGEDTSGAVVAAFVELRRAAQTVAFDCAAVCSREQTAGFARRAREAREATTAKASSVGVGCPVAALSSVRLVDASTERDALFDAAATAAAARRVFAARGEATPPDASVSGGSPDGDARDFRSAPVDFRRDARALDGDVDFAENMLRAFLADAESFAAKPPARASTEPTTESTPTPTSTPTSTSTPPRLPEARRRDTSALAETADWLGAPPLRAAIAALLERGAGEDAVRAARRAVRDLRAFADGLESRVGGACGVGEDGDAVETGNDGNDGNAGCAERAATSSKPETRRLPKKSASTDRVMRSGLYARSSCSLTDSGGGGADGTDDSDRSRRGSFGSGSDAVGFGARSSADSASGSRRERRGSWGGSSGRVSADSAGAAEGAVAALAALSPRARARGLAAIRVPRRKRGALAFDLPRALERADGDWDYAMGCAGRHAAAAREQIAVLRAVMRVDADDAGCGFRDDAQIVASAIAQLRSVAEGASVSHAPRLMDAVEALAAALVTASAGELESPKETSDAVNETPNEAPVTRSAWRSRATELLHALERRADEYVAAVDAAARTCRAFSPRFVFTDLCGGDTSAATEKLRVLVLAARDAHVAAVRSVAAAEASFGAAAFGGAFRESSRGISRNARPSAFAEDRSTGDEDLVAAAKPGRGTNDASDERAREATAHVPRDVFEDVRSRLSGAFGSLEACERLASSLCARPSERAFRGAAARIARIAIDVSAAAAGAGPPDSSGLARASAGVLTVPACFSEDEHEQTVASLAVLKREVEVLVADFHVIAPRVSLSAAPSPPAGKEVSGIVSRFFRRFAFASDLNPLASFALDWRVVPTSTTRLANRGTRRLRDSLCSENAVVGAATALFASYAAARLCGAALRDGD